MWKIIAVCSQQNISIFCLSLTTVKTLSVWFCPLVSPTQLWPIRTWRGEADSDRGAVPFCSVQIGLNCSGIRGVYRPGQRLFLIFLKPFLDGVSGLVRAIILQRCLFPCFSLGQCWAELYVCVSCILWPAKYFHNEKKKSYSKTSGHTKLSS